MLIDQSRRSGAEWSPDVRQIADAAGWRLVGGAWFCGRTCAPAPVQAPPPPPVLALQDASYQRSRVTAVHVEDREVKPRRAGR
jgi:hypothetical protein